jgi:hypothetical protein
VRHPEFTKMVSISDLMMCSNPSRRQRYFQQHPENVRQQTDHFGLQVISQEQHQPIPSHQQRQLLPQPEFPWMPHQHLPSPPPRGWRSQSEGWSSSTSRPCPIYPQRNNTEKNHTVPDSAQILYPREDIQSRVRFSTMISVYNNNFDLDELLECCWYSKSDLMLFKGERKTIIRMLRAVDFDVSQIDTVEHDLRGLEAYQ